MIACNIVLGSGKREVVLRSPLLVASGALGFAPSSDAIGGADALGALVTPELTASARRGAEAPALARTAAGYLLATGRRNPGVRRALRDHARQWANLGRPVIAALYGATPALLAEAAGLVGDDAGIHALELHLPHDAPAEDYGRAVRLVRGASMLPCAVRLAHDAAAVEGARAAEGARADALVVAAPPLGRVLGEAGTWTVGPLHTPALAPLTAQRIQAVRGASALPIIGRGGLATLADARSMLAAGACALQLDSILQVEPDALATLYGALEQDMAQLGAADWGGYLNALRGGDGPAAAAELGEES